MIDLTELSANQQAQIFTQFIQDLHERNRKSGGTIYGSYQILERLEEIAITKGIIECPYCKRKVK